jgi:hypothetical protein
LARTGSALSGSSMQAYIITPVTDFYVGNSVAANH